MPRTGRPRAEMVEVACAACAKPLLRYPSQVQKASSGRFFCSRACLGFVGGKPRRKPQATCEQCAGVFYPASGAPNRFCSKPCYDQWMARNRVEGVCEVCGAAFQMKPSQAKAWTRKWCSKACEGRGRMRRPLDRQHNGRPVLLTISGYLKVWEPGHPKARSGWILEHRLVAERVLGRYLVAEEHVHHKNGDKTDNQPENLEVMSASDHSSRTGYDRALRESQERERIQQELAELAEYRRRFGSLG